MSESIVVEKKLDFSIQVDHVKCKECSSELEFSLDCDSYGDLQIEVERCTCEDDNND